MTKSLPHILLVEDDPLDELLVLRGIRKAVGDLPVVITRDGRQAWTYLSEGKAIGTHVIAELPALVLLDIRLPIISGIELMTLIRETPRTSSLKVIAMSTSDEGSDIRSMNSLGVHTYVVKAIELEEFVARIEYAVRSALPAESGHV